MLFLIGGNRFCCRGFSLATKDFCDGTRENFGSGVTFFIDTTGQNHNNKKQQFDTSSKHRFIAGLVWAAENRGH